MKKDSWLCGVNGRKTGTITISEMAEVRTR